MRPEILSFITVLATAAVAAPAGGSGNQFGNVQDGQPAPSAQLIQSGQGRPFPQPTASIQGGQFNNVPNGQPAPSGQPIASMQGGQFGNVQNGQPGPSARPTASIQGGQFGNVPNGQPAPSGQPAASMQGGQFNNAPNGQPGPSAQPIASIQARQFNNVQNGQPAPSGQPAASMQGGQFNNAPNGQPGPSAQPTASIQGGQFNNVQNGQPGPSGQPAASIQGGQFGQAPSVVSKAAVSRTTFASVTKAATGNKAVSVTTTLPASSGSSVLSAVQTIAAGESFDGGMVMYDRGVECTGQEEGGDSDAVFEIEDGGSISNVIIGPNQIEGIHCYGSCTLNNVWWSAVCEDAFTVKEQDASGTTTITGGGAFGAEDKVLQHNGAGTISVSGFYVDTFGKLYRSCGNCDSMYTRHVIMDNIYAVDGSELAGINSNYNDTATIYSATISDVDDVCVTYEGNDDGDEPTELTSGADGTYCIYSTSDISEV